MYFTFLEIMELRSPSNWNCSLFRVVSSGFGQTRIPLEPSPPRTAVRSPRSAAAHLNFDRPGDRQKRFVHSYKT